MKLLTIAQVHQSGVFHADIKAAGRMGLDESKIAERTQVLRNFSAARRVGQLSKIAGMRVD